MNTSALARTTAAIALAALTAVGVTACSSARPHVTVSHVAKAGASSTASPSETSSPEAGLATRVQCLAVEGKLAGSAAELQSAMASLSGGDPSGAVGPLESVQKDLDDEIDTVTDPALKASATKLKTDFGQLVATVKAAADAIAAKNATAAQAQSAKLQSGEAALEADATALQQVCS